jgi:hypothetical protein
MKLTDSQIWALQYQDAVERYQPTGHLRSQRHTTYIALEKRGLLRRVFTSKGSWWWSLTEAGHAALKANSK